MSWFTWRLYRNQSALVAALFAVLAIVLAISGLHAAAVWHSALAQCAKTGSCGGQIGLNLSLSNSAISTLVVATAAVPLLPGLFWGAPMVAHELETGTNQLAWTQSITRRRWFWVRTGWLLLAAAITVGAVSALVTWWSGPSHALEANAFLANQFDVIDIVPVGYAVFAMALGICAGTLLRRTIPSLAVTLAGFVGIRALVSQWLRLHYMTPIFVSYKLTSNFTPPGDYLGVSQGILGPNSRPLISNYNIPNLNGVQIPAGCKPNSNPLSNPWTCLAAHGYRGYLTYQPANRFWTFQGIETAIFLTVAAALLGFTFWVLKRRDA